MGLPIHPRLRRSFLVVLAAASAAAVAAGAVAAPTGVADGQAHPSTLPPLVPDAVFPRCSPQQLLEIGFPDHKHAFTWKGWVVLQDSCGRTYGPDAFCRGLEVIPRPGLVVEPGRKAWGRFVLEHNTVYQDCEMLQFLELLDWAGHDVPALLGLDAPDTLRVVSPDNNDDYTAQTGNGIWRFYDLHGDRCVMEPWPVLQGRTLDGHAAFMLMTDRILCEAVPQPLPPWLHQGLVEYVGEHGLHLVNYMAQFRKDGPVCLAPAVTDSLLGRGPDPDAGRDREWYRKACYSAFLMVWELVENRGGLQPLRQWLALAAAGTALDDATRQVYGMDLAELAAALDPTLRAEPTGPDPQTRYPHRQP